MSEKRRNFVVSNYVEGEGMTMYTPVDMKQIKQIEKIVGSDFIDDLDLENPIILKEITDEESVDSNLVGASLDGMYSKEGQIKYLIDNGLEDWELDVIEKKYPEQLKKALSAKDIDELEG